MADKDDSKLSIRLGTGPADLEALRALRSQVFVQEFGLSERMVASPTDPDDAHVLVWAGRRAVGCLTLSETTGDRGVQRTYHLPGDGGGRSLRFTKLALLPEWRRSRLVGLLVAAGQYWVVDPAAPRFTWLVVYECQYRHIPLYAKLGFHLHGEARDAVGRCRVLIRHDHLPEVQRLVDTKRRWADALLARFAPEVAS